MSALPRPAPAMSGDPRRFFSELKITLQPKQEELLDVMESGRYRWLLFGGAQGGAKSGGMRRVNLIRRALYPGTGSLIFRRTLPELRLNHIDPMLSEWPQLEEFYNRSDRMLRLPNGSWTYFGSADHRGHLERVLGAEFGDVFVDEGQQLEWDWMEFLRTRNRSVVRVKNPSTGKPFKEQFVVGANPGGVGHGELKRRFLMRSYRQGENAEDYGLIRAFAQDNVEWARAALEDDGLGPADYYGWTDEERFKYFVARTERGKSMDRYPKRLRDAYLMGSWDTFVGQAFDVWDPTNHPVDLSSVDLQPWHPRWISLDWGFNHPCVVLFHASLGKRKRVTYREMVFRQRSPEEVAQAIVAVVKQTGEKPTDFLAGGDIKNRHMDEQTIEKRMNRVLLENGLPQVREGNTGRSAGYQLVYDLLATKDLLITKNCSTLVDTLTLAKIDEDSLDDVEKFPGDDAYDCLKVGMLRDDDPLRVPVEERVRERLEEQKAAGTLPSRETNPTDLFLTITRTMKNEEKRDTFRAPVWAKGLRRGRKVQ